jgi:hypothetical protein
LCVLNPDTNHYLGIYSHFMHSSIAKGINHYFLWITDWAGWPDGEPLAGDRRVRPAC